MPCPDLEHIDRFAENALSAEESVAIERHLTECESCRRQVENVNKNLELVRRLVNVDLDPKPADAPDARQADRPTVLQSQIHTAQGKGLPDDAFPGYTLTNEISRGGQGVIYRAIQQATKRKVAIKVMRHGALADARERARFEREAHILGQLNHPNIVAIHDGGSVGENAFYVMDYISGKPLDEYTSGLIEHAGTPEETLRQIVAIFAKVCEAVHAAHLKGIIHRDLKPSNIRVDQNGEPHVLDFGIAKLSGVPDHSPAMTLTGEFIGSVPWSSPEQAEGHPDHVDIRTDVYSLGVILYQLLTGQFPYDITGNVREALDRIARAEPARLAAAAEQTRLEDRGTARKSIGLPASIIDSEIETIVLRCLSKDRERRYQSAGDLARDLRHYLAGEPIEARRDSALYIFRKNLWRYRLTVRVAAGFVLLAAVSLIAMAVFYERERFAHDRAEDQSMLANQRLAALQREHEETLKQTKIAKDERDKAREEQRKAENARQDAKSRFDEAHQSAELLNAFLMTKGDAVAAEPAFRDAVERAVREHGEAAPIVATCKYNYGELLRIKGEPAKAERLLSESLEVRRDPTNRIEPILIAQTMHALGDVLCDLDKYEQAIERYQEARSMLDPRQPDQGRQRIAVQIALGRAFIRTSEFRRSEGQLMGALDAMDQAENVPQLDRLLVVKSLGDLYRVWDLADPAHGHEKAAREWRDKLEQLRATTRPATSSLEASSDHNANGKPK